MTEADAIREVEQRGVRAKSAARTLAQSGTNARNAALAAIDAALSEHAPHS